MNKITAHSLDIQPSQKLALPLGTKLLTVNVDHRFNKCLLWTSQDDSAAISEDVTFTMAKLNDEASTGQYVGTFKDNSGYVHVFASNPAVTAIKAVTPVASASLTIGAPAADAPTKTVLTTATK